ncbi:MAG: transferrin receptor-like dimerization domain-containing protein [Longimicrobiales bacterium]|nr:transferrin receptor-like dimerization domain-containing protein [Longimicrobiales bacterium]
MHARTLIVPVAVAVGLAATPQSQEAPPLLGFSSSAAAEQFELEARFDAQLDADRLREWMRRLTAEPFWTGSPYNREMAEWKADLFRSWGFDVEIEEFQVLYPLPRIRRLEQVSPSPYTARLREPAIEGDPVSGVEENRLPTFNAFSADGDVTAELVYVNQGVPADYEELERRGIDVEGKIVIARYGGSWRGIKPKVAAERGAIGAILYSDPIDDGFVAGDVYPEGPWRNEWGVQRGSVLDMPQYPGDPLTPGYGATAEAERLEIEEAPTIMKIPVLPISYADAQPLLASMEGPVAPQGWQGGLPVTYHMGPGPATVRLQLEFDWDLRPAYDVIARIEGSEYPDEWIVRGNHRDGWALGAADPISGLVTLMEEARAVGVLMETGWRPNRTIVYAGWDAEEPALLGSTEWAEHHREELQQKAALYINTDGNGRGFLNAGGSHSLERFVTQIARDVDDPQTGVSVLERWQAALLARGEEAVTPDDIWLSPLGSGSDYTPFLQHLGIASLNLSFGGESGGGSYHSQYDSFEHYTRFIDPTFEYGIALTKVAGRATLRFAQADVLPHRFSNLASNVATYADEVQAMADEMRRRTERHNRLVRQGMYDLAADPTKPYVPPEADAPVPYFNFAPLLNAVAELRDAATAYDERLRTAQAEGLDDQETRRLNEHLLRVEQLLTDDRGLPKRPWFRHQIYAPGFYTGYGVKTLPGIREAIEEREFELVDEQMQRVSAALRRLNERLAEARDVLERPGR